VHTTDYRAAFPTSRRARTHDSIRGPHLTSTAKATPRVSLLRSSHRTPFSSRVWRAHPAASHHFRARKAAAHSSRITTTDAAHNFGRRPRPRAAPHAPSRRRLSTTHLRCQMHSHSRMHSQLLPCLSFTALPFAAPALTTSDRRHSSCPPQLVSTFHPTHTHDEHTHTPPVRERNSPVRHI